MPTYELEDFLADDFAADLYEFLTEPDAEDLAPYEAMAQAEAA